MRVLRRFVAGLVTIAIVAGCSSTASDTSPQPGVETEPVTVAVDSPDTISSTDTQATAEPTTGGGVTTTVLESVDDTSATLDTTPPASAILQPPPAPLALVGTPQEQAVQLADAFGRRDAERAPALLAAFGAAGLSVVDEHEQSLTPVAGTVGMPWVFVSNVSTATNADARLALSEVARIFAADGIEPHLDDAAVAADLVNGLRFALAGDGSVPGPTMIALLVQEEARRATGVDLADPTTTPDQIEVSMPTAALLVSAGLLSSIGQYAATVAVPSRLIAHEAPRLALTAGCATDPEGQWALWLLSKVFAGADIPGVGWEGLFGTVIGHLEQSYPHGTAPGLSQLKAQYGKVASAAGFLAAALTAASAIAATLTLTADVRLKEGEPLIRTKKSAKDGNAGTIVVIVSFDYGSLDTSTVNAINCLLSALVVAGNNSTLPVPGPVSGVAVTIEGLEGFGHGLITEGSFVLLNTPLKAETDNGGKAEFSVIGRHQRVDIPDSAPPFDRTFTVSLEAPADPTDASGLAKHFFDSFLCAGGALAGKVSACVDPIANIWRMTNFDLGAWRFRLVDWAQDYKVDALIGGLHFQATKCAGIAGTWEFTVDTTAGNYHPTTTLSIVVDRDPVPGGTPASVVSGPLRFYDSVVQVGYEESYSFDFYGDGADSPSGAPPGSPAIGIDESLGGGAFPILAGNFC